MTYTLYDCQAEVIVMILRLLTLNASVVVPYFIQYQILFVLSPYRPLI